MNEEVGAFAYFYQTFFSKETFPEKNQDELIIRNSKKSDSNSSEDKKKRKEKESKIEKFGTLDLSFYIYNWRVTASSKPLQLILKGDVYYRKLWTVGRASADFYSSGRINVR